jgi:hemerythrin-like metal-binding protein
MARECLHRVLFATIGHFGREEGLMRDRAPAEQFQAHAASHAEIHDAIQQAIAAFAQDKDAIAALAEIAAIARLYRQHHQNFDSVCRLRLLAGEERTQSTTQQSAADSGVPYDLPAIPPTGNDLIDHNHTLLQNILRQAKSLCREGAADCHRCPTEQQQCCTANAIDIVTDVLKTMIEHFRHEESLMRHYPCPAAADEHIQAHADISHRMSQLIADYADNNTAMFLHRLRETLHAWLKHHVVEHDLPLIKLATTP